MMYDVPILPKIWHRSRVDKQTMANRETIESLVPRVEGLAKSLSKPAPKDEIKEIVRRQELKE